MQSLLRTFGRTVEPRAVIPGALVSAGTALAIGVGLGSLVPERTAAAYAINAALFAGLIGGGAVAGWRARTHHLIAASLTSGPVMAVAVVVQLIRRFGFGEAVPPLALPLAMALAASLASLGGVLARLVRSRRPSLAAPAQPQRARPSVETGTARPPQPSG